MLKDRILPLHKHPEEQTGHLVSGHLILIIDGERYEMVPGDRWAIPGDVEHGEKTWKILWPWRYSHLPVRTIRIEIG